MTDEKPFELKLNNDKYVTIDELTKIDLAGTKPIDFVIGNNPPVSVKFWRLLLSKTVNELIKLYPHKDILHFSSANTRMLLRYMTRSLTWIHSMLRSSEWILIHLL